MQVQGYKKKSKTKLLKEINECKTISQLCALVQHEGIVIQMRCDNGGRASNIPVKKLPTGKFIEQESPLDKMKREIAEIVKAK